MQSVLLARLLSHIPPPRMGMERRNVRKFRSPIRWLLVLIAGVAVAVAVAVAEKEFEVFEEGV